MEMKLNYGSGKEIGKFIRDIHKGIYNDSCPGSVFDGGNVGNIVLGLSLIKVSENLVESARILTELKKETNVDVS